MLLDVQGVSTGYGRLTVVRDASLTVDAGEIVAVVGSNGVGKTTLLKGITRSLPITAGRVVLDGIDITGTKPNQLAGLGLGYVPQVGSTFPDLTVMENLLVSVRGSLSTARERCSRLLARFPELERRRDQAASTLSGGERQMLAIASALLSSPRLLVLDEPTTGLAPLVVQQRIDDIRRLRDEDGAGVLWVIEEHPRICLPAVDRVYFLSDGTVSAPMRPADLLEEGVLEELFFGVRA
ncbi:ATP-binding cassette domain-containing protein [Geodermatophilus sp. DF01-2]|uniref:ABC transporter ATP-binding protein n=1 Tax=Geodermatophilus sp. DF01-2 TaxID=2559610 RepID=UPI00107464BC|nr:ATP-binding cassette domain-containing protein [Geodermatophilus sp. DF01_2]TFV59841.1 ATP-binding cassette domain-containing protein [Geodermatophilus sp. DF01_2]